MLFALVVYSSRINPHVYVYKFNLFRNRPIFNWPSSMHTTHAKCSVVVVLNPFEVFFIRNFHISIWWWWANAISNTTKNNKKFADIIIYIYTHKHTESVGISDLDFMCTGHTPFSWIYTISIINNNNNNEIDARIVACLRSSAAKSNHNLNSVEQIEYKSPEYNKSKFSNVHICI